MDKIIIKGLKIFAYHGVNPEEKVNGQNFEVDVVMYANLSKPCKTDNIEDTISYSQVRKVISRIMTERAYNLIEKVAYRVAEQILIEFDSICEVDVTLKKPEAPMNADFEYVAVEISKRRDSE